MAATSEEMDEGDSDISITSTVDEIDNSDDEWTAEGIRAEGVVEGKTKYLVEWTGYPLHDATWEPMEHLNDVLLEEWKSIKANGKTGQGPNFKISTWKAAVAEHLTEKWQRHEKRNVKRIRLGLGPTKWNIELQDLIRRTNEYWPDDESQSNSTNAMSESQDSRSVKHTEKPSQLDLNPNPQSSGASEDWVSKPANRQKGDNNDDPATIQPNTSRPRASPLSQSSTTQNSNGVAGQSEVPNTPTRRGSASAPQQCSPASKSKIMPGAKHRTSNPGSNHDSKQIGSPELPLQIENVFVGGKIQKKKPTLQEASKDVTKTPQLLKHRYQRYLAKASRDMEDNAPAQIPRNLIVLDSKAPERTISLLSDTQPSTGTAEQEASGDDMDIDTSQPNLPTMESASTEDVAKAPEPLPADKRDKRRKSVRWNDNVEINSFNRGKDGSVEPSLFVPDGPLVRSPENEDGPDATASLGIRRPPTPPLPRSQERMPSVPSTPAHNITKTCFFGNGATRSMSLVFKGVSQCSDSPYSWLGDFRDRPRLEFTHTCTALDFRSQFRGHPSMYPNMACGTIWAPTDHSDFETVADRLRLNSMGMLCHLSEFCILAFPSKSEDWDFEAEDIASTDGPMKYIVFQPNLAPTDLIVRRADPTARTPVTVKLPDQESWETSLPRGLGIFSGLDYNHVFPTYLQTSSQHHIFLAFPPSALEEARLMALWLNVSTCAECVIYDSFSPGDWSRFVGNDQGGAVVFHENALWKVRQFPDMFDVLSQATRGKPGRRYAFSVFRRGCGGTTVASSWSARSPRVGDLSLRRVFPGGKVFLLTPTFIMSEPKQAAVFIRFFNKLHGSEANSRGQMAVAAGIDEWIARLAEERSSRASRTDQSAHEAETSILVKLAHDMGKLVRASSDDEATSPLVFAPPTIDGCDEQSLVNWFGWWTIMNCDCHSRFYVLGSSRPNNLTRFMRPIVYDKDVIEDADSEMGPVDQEAAGRASESPGNILAKPPAAHDGALRLARNRDAESLKDSLKDILRGMPRRCPICLWYNPVAYWDPGTPYRLHDVRGVYGSFSQWFNFLSPFDQLTTNTRTGTGRNTLAGFFHTPVEGWEAVADHDAAHVARRPWLAFFRPVNPHARPWRGSELLIWDMKYFGEMRKDQEVREEDLVLAHRHLIRIVNEGNRHKNPSMPLNKVWVGGWERATGNYTDPVDVTLDFLHRCAEDTKFWLPAPQPKMPERGWKLVRKPVLPPPETPREESAAASAEANSAMEVDSHANEEYDDDWESSSGEVPRILFLPPRSKKVGRGTRSLSTNTLYQQSKAAVAKSGQEPVLFGFQTTKAWYGQQVAEGRDFKHILVSDWKAVFKELNIRET